MCPGSPLGSSWPQSRGQTQAVDQVYPHPKNGSQNRQKLGGLEGGKGMPHPQGRVSHCWCLPPPRGWDGRLLALDLEGQEDSLARVWGSGARLKYNSCFSHLLCQQWPLEDAPHTQAVLLQPGRHSQLYLEPLSDTEVNSTQQASRNRMTSQLRSPQYLQPSREPQDFVPGVRERP